jgi:hypothetical protein
MDYKSPKEVLRALRRKRRIEEESRFKEGNSFLKMPEL